ncbi:Uncharacterised protein [Bordetella ansorpii]|uniref:Uncharacterized protein n=1 Tax=Bordetella ansorpii TaxID=288768 RepID=A0A157P2Q6_9BORD|nr:hypothetical protein [Bordetella ansorpii]SAI27845.1 Uncharacterised protein [Bordetella ansorpii]
MFAIPAGDFTLALKPLQYLPDESGEKILDWLKVDLHAATRHIDVRVQWEMMWDEVNQLRELIDELYQAIRDGAERKTVSYDSREGILRLDMQIVDPRLGSITLDYVICPDNAQGTKVIGSTVIDQTYLPAMANGLDALSRFAG